MNVFGNTIPHISGGRNVLTLKKEKKNYLLNSVLSAMRRKINLTGPESVIIDLSQNAFMFPS
jgi:hypothetical protein